MPPPTTTRHTSASSLARRVDYEVLRAREWRADSFQPLDPPGGATPTAGASAGAVAVDRATRLLEREGPSPGKRVVAGLETLTLLVVVLAAVAGLELARRALGQAEAEPVNILWFLIHALGAQSIFLLLTIGLGVALTARLEFLSRLLAGTLHLGSWLVAAAMRLAVRPAPPGERQATAGVASRRLRDLGAHEPLVLVISNAAWVAYNLGFLLAAGILLSAEHHTFGWQSTLLSPDRAARLIATLTAPARVWPGAVSDEQIALSRYAPNEKRFTNDGPDPARALAMRQAWSTQLLAAVVALGLVPRLALLLGSAIAWRRARSRLLPDSTDPYLIAVFAHAVPGIDTTTVPVAGTTGHVDPIRQPPEPANPPLRWWLATVLSAAAGDDTVRLLWGAPREGWAALPRLDRREHERQALATVATDAGRGLAFVCDYALTPDRALGALIAKLRDAAEATTVFVILSGGEAFRATRLGATPAGVARRRELWRDTIAAWGVREDQLIDFDVTNATIESRALLARRLGGDRASQRPDSARAFHAALVAIEDAAPSWAHALTAAEAAHRDGVALELVARARVLVDRAFELEGAPPLSSDHGVVAQALTAGLEAALAKQLRCAESTALTAAARSLAGMWSLLRRLEELEPKFVLAGLAAGLVAGPLGGAIAAGGAGLLAGASLMSTLGGLGALLGSAASLRTARVRPGEATVVDGDERLGLIARSAVIRAVVLRHQGREEAVIAEAIAAVAARGSNNAVATAADVRELIALLRQAEAVS